MSHGKNILPDGLERLNYGEGSQLKLRGQSGAVVTMQADGPITIQWSPDDYRGLDVEMRIQLLDFMPFDINAPTSPPDVRFSMQFGHGRQTYSLPQLPSVLGAVASLAPFFEYNVPARGLVQRMTAREIKLILRAPVKVDGSGPYDQVRCAVSFMPTHSMASNALPMQIDAASGFLLTPFPIEAREWRLADEAGVPFAALAASFGILDFVGQAILLGADAHDWAEFRPIPVQGMFWGSAGSRLQATFR